jgi:hypothetical protein
LQLKNKGQKVIKKMAVIYLFEKKCLVGDLSKSPEFAQHHYEMFHEASSTIIQGCAGICRHF